ncbi:glycosyl transferase [Lachnoclostridium sp. An169]|uniref:ATP-grasp fold amidoligase family protein n=1 Tax=Lachnoclostridium sp. An169 TaxID=1965569 RepID=UPI000B5847CF|nr:ATP-grasp fold amidoligase family protein [Lachnoclostridium sp. An169]OUP82400.1 glycosyl transferase [Lachnoclostridium sp. An169]
MHLIKGIRTFLFDKEKRTIFLAQHGFYKTMSDRDFLCMQFKNVFGYDLNLENPQTYNEKLQWLKLNDRNPQYVQLVDKYQVKEIVANIIGEQYIIPTLGVWDSFDEIDFSKLPNQFVLKCTHDSGGLVICTNKSKLNMSATKKKIDKCLKNDYYMQNREWPYKDVPRRIIAEAYMVDESGYELKDYKFFCFDGKVKAMFIASDRESNTEETKFDFFDAEFRKLPFTNGHPNSTKQYEKPKTFEEMKSLAEKISAGLPQARIDFYDVNGKVYFGEITFFHWSGFKKFEPPIWDKKFGEWIDLTRVKK